MARFSRPPRKFEPGISNKPKTPPAPTYRTPSPQELELVKTYGPFSLDEIRQIGRSHWGTYAVEQVDFLRKWGEEKYRKEAKHFRPELAQEYGLPLEPEAAPR